MEVLRRRPPTPSTSRRTASNRSEHPLPPRVPEELEELKEAVTLLGAYIQVLKAASKMKQSRLERLRDLLGAVPSMSDATAWKAGLKELWNDLAELEKRPAS